MKLPRMVFAVGALLGALFLSGCMAAMLPAMLLGHAAHGRKDAAPAAKPCACEMPAAGATAVQAAPVAPPVGKPASPPGGGHPH